MMKDDKATDKGCSVSASSPPSSRHYIRDGGTYLFECEFDKLAIVRFDHALDRFHHGLNFLLITSESAHLRTWNVLVLQIVGPVDLI